MMIWKGDSLLLSLEKEIIPFIKSRYNTGSRNILVGHSLGGTFVTYALLSNLVCFNVFCLYLLTICIARR